MGGGAKERGRGNMGGVGNSHVWDFKVRKFCSPTSCNSGCLRVKVRRTSEEREREREVKMIDHTHCL